MITDNNNLTSLSKRLEDEIKEEKEMPIDKNKTNQIKKDGTPNTDGVTPASEQTTDEINSNINALINEGMNDADNKVDQSADGITNNFGENKSKDKKDKKELTDAEKEAKRRERDQKILDNNKAIQRKIQNLISASGEFTEEQELFREYGRKCIKFVGALVENSPYSCFSVSTTFQKDDNKNYIFDKSATEADKNAIKLKNATVKKMDVLTPISKVKYSRKRFSNLFGFVLQIPTKLIVPPTEFNLPTFKSPTIDEVTESPIITTALNFSDAFTIIQTSCSQNTISECAELYNITKEKYTPVDIVAMYKVGSTTKSTKDANGNKIKTKIDIKKRVFDTTGNRHLLIKENTLPLKYFSETAVDNASPDTVDAIQNILLNGFKKRSDEKRARFSVLDNTQASLVSFTKDEAGNDITSVTANFIGNQSMLATCGLYTTDPYTVISNPVSGKLEAQKLNNPVVEYTKKVSSKGAPSYKPKFHNLGSEGYSLDDVALMGYPIATIFKSLGITEDKIIDVYKEDLERKNNEKSLKSTRIKAISNVVDAEKASLFTLKQITSGKNLSNADRAEFNPDKFRSKMIDLKLSGTRLSTEPEATAE